jgi:hypothetical protein
MLIFLLILFCVYAFFGITVFSVVLLILGIYVTAGNWYILINYYINKKTSSSIPIFGGLFVCIALWNLLPCPWHWLSLLSLVIDYGCLPLMLGTLFYLVTGKYKDNE